MVWLRSAAQWERRLFMNGVDNDPAKDRRGRIIGRLVEHYQAAPEPDKWLQAMTLQALRALDRADLAPAEKSPARKEIHAIHREVASKARALKLSRHAAGLQSPDSGRNGSPPASSVSGKDAGSD